MTQSIRAVHDNLVLRLFTTEAEAELAAKVMARDSSESFQVFAHRSETGFLLESTKTFECRDSAGPVDLSRLELSCWRGAATKEDFFENAALLIEATTYEHLCLWKGFENHQKWKQIPSGFGATVGTLDNRPVHISLTYAIVHNRVVIFWEATSVVVDYNLIQTWLKAQLARYHRKPDSVTRVNAMNANGPLNGLAPALVAEEVSPL